MSARETLAAIARGGQLAGLLQNCRYAEGEAELYGIEAIVARFRAAPLAIDPAQTVSSAGILAAIVGETVLVAEAYGPNIGHLWRIGPDAPPAAEPRIDVAFDPDMAQARGDVMAAASDFPDIDAATVERIAAAMRRELGRWEVDGLPASRARAFLLRVAAEGGTCVALFAVHALGSGERTGAGFVHAAIVLHGEDVRLVRGAAPEPRWTPRVG